jgi:hypothetical protein
MKNQDSTKKNSPIRNNRDDYRGSMQKRNNFGSCNVSPDITQSDNKKLKFSH